VSAYFREHRFRRIREQRRDLRGIECGALGEQLLGDAGAGFLIREQRLQGIADAGFVRELGEAEEFFVVRGAVELREQFRDAGGAAFGSNASEASTRASTGSFAATSESRNFATTSG
jgi:hypothetical protein